MYFKIKRYVVAAVLSCVSLHATITIKSFTPSMRSPQPVGTPVSFDASATDSNPGPLTFQFNVAYDASNYTVLRNFNIGVNDGGVWSPQPFTWASIKGEGSYVIQVVVKNFTTGETASQTVPFDLTSLVSRRGTIAAVPSENPLVGLAAIPPCPVGSSVRAYFTSRKSPAPTYTSFQPCGGTISSNIYLGGALASDLYTVGYQIQTGQKIVDGQSTDRFRTGRPPRSVSFPVQTVLQPPTGRSNLADQVLLHAYINLGTAGDNYQPAATDLAGNVTWFYNGGNDLNVLLTRPLPGGHFMVFQTALSWDTRVAAPSQLVRQVDLAGNVEKETNIGLLQQQLLALGATDLQACRNIALPATVGSACLKSFSHDAILMPNGDYAFIGTVEKIFPPGTQGDTTGLNVDILGDAIIVIDPSLNAVWYDDTFQHDGGGNQLNINRPAVLGETCAQDQGGCPPLFLAGTAGVTTLANDWLHCNSLQFRTTDSNFVMSSRHQDWVMLFDYTNGTGNGDILWRMGLDGDFAFNNINNDPYPWFSHQHDAAFETTGVFDVFDNGNTRITELGTGNSRGIALNVDESSFTVTPELSQDLGYYGYALGSAQLLSNGNYHFQPGIVAPNNFDYSIELFPTPGTTLGTPVYNLESAVASYRSFRMPSLYDPPTN